MANKKPAFLKPDIDFSDDEGDEDPLATRPSSKKISNQIKKTQTNKNAIKNPNASNIDEDEDPEPENNEDDEVIISEDDSPQKSNRRASKRKPAMSNAKNTKKKKKATDSDDDFLGEDSDESNDSEDEESVASEDMSEENISDSDFNPESDEEIEAEKEEYFEGQEGDGEATINLSSDGDSPDKKDATKTFDPNSREFWDKVQELRSKGFSIQQAGNGENTKSAPIVNVKNVPVSPAKGRGPQNNSRLTAFTNLVINFDHEKRCIRKCFLMDPKQKQTLLEIQNPNLLSPEFVKGCIKIVNCNARLGEIEAAKEAIEITSNLGSIPGVSALCQAMISGVKAQMNNISQLIEFEKEGMGALKAQEYPKAIEFLDKSLELAGSCLRLKMARGDCLAHLGRYVEGAKVASSILQQDQRNVGALFLRGFCLYHKNNIDRALTHFQQVLQLNKDHSRAKTLLNKAKQFKDKRDLAIKAKSEKRLEDAEKLLTDALAIDPRNKGTNANLLAERAEIYFTNKKYKQSVEDCEASLALDPGCHAAMLQRAKCHIEGAEWEQAIRIMERMNTRDRINQQGKVKAGEAAQMAGNMAEALRLFSEAIDVDKHNQKYRHILRDAKQQCMLQTRVDFYAVLGIEKTVGDSEIRKAYFKKSKEYHPDRHSNDSEEVKEEFSKKFKLAKEAYEILSDNDKRKMYDSGRVKAPPGGWYQDVEKKIFEFVQMRGGMRGRGIIRGVVRGGVMRGNVMIRQPIVRGPVMVRGRGQAIRGIVRAGARPGMRPMLRPGTVRPNMVRPRGPINVTRTPLRGAANGVRPNMNGNQRPKLNGISITPLGDGGGSLPSFNNTWGKKEQQ